LATSDGIAKVKDNFAECIAAANCPDAAGEGFSCIWRRDIGIVDFTLILDS
jgi:hypothetical protein